MFSTLIESSSRSIARRANRLLDLHTVPRLEPIAQLSNSQDNHESYCLVARDPQATPSQSSRYSNSNLRARNQVWRLWAHHKCSQSKFWHSQCLQSKSVTSHHRCALNNSLAILAELLIWKWTLSKCPHRTLVSAVVSRQPNRLVKLALTVCAKAEVPSHRSRFLLSWKSFLLLLLIQTNHF